MLMLFLNESSDIYHISAYDIYSIHKHVLYYIIYIYIDIFGYSNNCLGFLDALNIDKSNKSNIHINDNIRNHKTAEMIIACVFIILRLYVYIIAVYGIHLNEIYTIMQVYLYALCIYIGNYIHICKQIHTI